MSQDSQVAPPGAQHAFPQEIFHLAASYGLGQPQAQYSHAGAGCLRIAIASFLGLLTLMAALLFGVFFIVLARAQLPGSPSPSFLLIFIVPLLAILAFMFFGFSLRRSRAYACSGGFIVLRSKRVVCAMRWDQIQQVWKKSVQTIGSAGQPAGSSMSYFIRDVQGQTYDIDFLPIWKRANYEHARLEFARLAPQMLADFNAGRYLLFGQLSVDQHGVSIPGSMTYRSQSYLLPLPAIVKASLSEKLTFEIAAVGGTQTVTVKRQIPENASGLLLLLAILSKGRIICEYEDWLIA